MAGTGSATEPFHRVGGAPPPDGSRVDAIRDAIDLGQPDLAATYGERAGRDILSLVERLLAETRAGDLVECASLVIHVDDRLHGLDPAALRPRRGAAGWFDSRRRRLKRFRQAFMTAGAAMSETAGAMVDHATGVMRRSRTLDRLWGDTRAAITELDAHVAAGLRRLKQDPLGETSHPLIERLAALVALRNAAVRQLPLVRLAQNGDCRTPDRLKELADAVAEWREAWRERLGLTGKRPRKIIPDQVGLARDRDRLVSALAAVRRDLDEAAARRAQTALRMGRVAETMRRTLPQGPAFRDLAPGDHGAADPAGV